MKFNHLILSMRKHISSTGFFCVKYGKYELLSEVTERPQLSPDARQEPWSHTTSPDPLWGRAPAAGQQSAARGAREGTPGVTAPGDGRHAVEVGWGRRGNAWSLENHEQDLGLWEKLYSSKGKIKSSLITILTWRLPYGEAQLFSQTEWMEWISESQGCELRTDERLRKESRFLKVTNIGDCDKTIWFQRRLRQLRGRRYRIHRKKWKPGIN